MSDREAVAWSFKTQAQTTTDSPPKKKIKKTPEQTTRAVTEQASTPASAPASKNFFSGNEALWVAVGISAALFLFWVLSKLFGKNPNETSPQAPPAPPAPHRASYTIPHCDYQKTAEGFVVTFSKSSLYAHGQLDKNSIHNPKASLTGILFGATAAAFSPTVKIEVTKDAVIVDGYAMAREDFGTFHCAEWEVNRRIYVRLAYQFGHESRQVGGGWEPREGKEFTAALNRHLRMVHSASDEVNPHPDDLRSAAPSNEFD